MTETTDGHLPHSFKTCKRCIHFVTRHCKVCGKREGDMLHDVGYC